MKPDEVREAARRLAERTRAEQGLPPHVVDESVLAKVANLIRLARGREDGHARR